MPFRCVQTLNGTSNNFAIAPALDSLQRVPVNLTVSVNNTEAAMLKGDQPRTWCGFLSSRDSLKQV
jgi:hypothetical protein